MTKRNLRFPGKPIEFRKLFHPLKDDEFGKEVVRRVNAKFKGTYAEIPLSTIVRGGYVEHSNAYTGPAIFTTAQDQGVRTMRPEEAQILFRQGRIPDQGRTYQDIALAFDFSGKNHGLALDLYKRLPTELRDLDKMPGVLIDLELEKTDNPAGVRYVFTANSQLRTTPIINTSGGNFDENDPELTRTGFPSKTGYGNKILCTNGRNEVSLENLGLVGVCLYDLGNINAGNGCLLYSNSNGRVVLVKYAEGVAKK